MYNNNCIKYHLLTIISLSHLVSFLWYLMSSSLHPYCYEFRVLSSPALVYHIFPSYTFPLSGPHLPQSLTLWSSHAEFLSILPHTKPLLTSKSSNIIFSPLLQTFFSNTDSPFTFTGLIFIISGLSLIVTFYQKPSLIPWHIVTFPWPISSICTPLFNLYFSSLSILFLVDYLLVCLPN